MPDTPLERSRGDGYPSEMEARVAVLEQIARSTAATLERIDRRIEAVEAGQRADFRWLLGVQIGMFGTMIAGFASLLAVMAHGFRWL